MSRKGKLARKVRSKSLRPRYNHHTKAHINEDEGKSLLLLLCHGAVTLDNSVVAFVYKWRRTHRVAWKMFPGRCQMPCKVAQI